MIGFDNFRRCFLDSTLTLARVFRELVSLSESIDVGSRQNPQMRLA